MPTITITTVPTVIRFAGQDWEVETLDQEDFEWLHDRVVASASSLVQRYESGNLRITPARYQELCNKDLGLLDVLSNEQERRKALAQALTETTTVVA